MGGGADEEWVNAAMSDDAMVVELLVRLNRAPPPKQAPLPLEWSVRQRRSKPATVNNKARKPGRSSPTTPLSWSDASHDSTLLIPFKTHASTRSKSNVDGEKINSKRGRKKKSLAELKDEESSLLKERRELKREMAALRMNLERQRATHERLKRMKPSPESTSIAEESVSDQQLQMGSTASDPTTTTTLAPPLVSVPLQSSVSNACCNGDADAASASNFILPDLNVPFDEPT